MAGKVNGSTARTLSFVQLLGAAVACAALVLLVFVSSAPAQTAGRNVNMVSGTKWPDGDPYLQRQNEPSVAASTRNPLHLLAGANDYRTVDIPFVDGADVTGDAWLGVFKSFDGGQRWTSTLIPGYPQDTPASRLASPLRDYAAAADPVVRAGTNGLLYYSGMVFDRTDNGKSAIFVARFIDNNNQENGDTISYVDASIIAASTGAGGEFFDKPWLAVDIPRGGAATCRIVTTGATGSIAQTIPAGNAYVAYTRVWYDSQGLLYSEIRFTSSTDCGRTWSRPVRLSRAQDRLNQGASIAIDPNSGRVFVAWRRISAIATDSGNAIMAVRAPAGGGRAEIAREVRCLPRHGRDQPDPRGYFEHRRRKDQEDDRDTGRADREGRGGWFNWLDWVGWLVRTTPGHAASKKPAVAGDMVGEFDQSTEDIYGSVSFRSNAYPSLAIDGNGRLYLAWTERGFATGQANPGLNGDARVVVSTSNNATVWSDPRPVANEGNPGHQLMPTLTFGGGKLVLVYYDLRDDVAKLFTPFVDEGLPPERHQTRHTLDMRASFGAPGARPVFQPSVRVSDYLMGYPAGVDHEVQLQYNAPNLPMFRLGTAPFMGDYVDVALAPAFVPAANGRWAYNTSGALPVFHAVWTDNRDVRAPNTDTDGDGNPWNDYTAPTMRAAGTPSVFDPADPNYPVLPVCSPGNTGARNQNIYTARLTTGLLVGSPGNTKPLSTSLPRAFVVFAQNTSPATKAFRLAIVNQPPGGRASFRQFDAGAAPLTTLDVTTPAWSTASRSVYATSSDPTAQVQVTVTEITAAGGLVASGGLNDVVVLNPDSTTPALTNPAITNPAITNPAITNAEVYNPAITNPAITNPAITNPAITNPAITNPAITNPAITNPAITNPAITNPDMTNPAITNNTVVNPAITNPAITNPAITNPAITNPAITNPAITNPAITNGSLTDVTWTMTNTGNTTAAFNVNLFLAATITKLCSPTNQAAGCIATQLIIQKTYTTPTATACTLEVETHDILVANIENPTFVTPSSPAPPQNDPAATNGTIWLAPGETAVITLRITDPNRIDNVNIGGATIDEAFLPPVPGGGGGAGLPVPAGVPQSVATDAPAGVTTPPVVYAAGRSAAFTVQPSPAVVNAPISPMVRVQVRDAAGAGVPGAQVTLTLFGTSGHAMLTGNQALTAVDGTAAFPLLRVDTPGTGYQLQATATPPPGADPVATAFSLPFAVWAMADGLNFVVTNVNDSGPGSLRQAMLYANSNPGPDSVTFNIPGAGPYTIVPASPLPALSGVVTIDGYTQPGAAPGAPIIEVNGNGLGGWGLYLSPSASACRIQGLVINGFGSGPTAGAGIGISGNSNTITGNFIGTDVTGTIARGNNGDGILVYGSNNVIGGSSLQARNIISGNKYGMSVNGVSGGGAGNVIQGNYIGLDRTGSTALGNLTHAINLNTNAANNRVVGNVLSGNLGNGVLILTGSHDNVLEGNFIGTDATGTLRRGNAGGNGVNISDSPNNTVGGALPAARNIIAANSGAGVSIGGATATGNRVQGNYIGTNVSGTAAFPNGSGVSVSTSNAVIGGSTPGSGNLVSGNLNNGITISGASATGNVVAGNIVGTNALGTGALPNGNAGVQITNSGSNNIIGGSTPEARNLISGAPAGRNNVSFRSGASNNVVRGNYIGTNLAGTAAIRNDAGGGVLIGESSNNTIADNLISGTNHGVLIVVQAAPSAASGNVITGNRIGTDASGTGVIGGLAAGVWIQDGASNNTVGGSETALGNVIRGNVAGGVMIQSGSGNTVLSNTIASNGFIGIDLGTNGTTLNDAPAALDADSGANNLQNYPVVTQVLSSGGSTTIEGVLYSAASTAYTLQFFSNTTCSASGYGQGETLLRSSVVTTGPAGDVPFTLTFPVPVVPGQVVTATATDPAGNTSEFSKCRGLGVNQPPTAGSLTLSTRQDQAIPIFLNASDPEGATLIYTTSQPQHGTLTGPGVGQPANRTYTPTAGYKGPDSFTFTVNDGALTSNVATVTIAVGMIITTPSLPDGIRMKSYGTCLSVTNFTGNVTWSLSGDYPAGLSLLPGGCFDGATSRPMETGRFAFDVQAVDSSNPPQTATMSYEMRVHAIDQATLGQSGGTVVTLAPGRLVAQVFTAGTAYDLTGFQLLNLTSCAANTTITAGVYPVTGAPARPDTGVASLATASIAVDSWRNVPNLLPLATPLAIPQHGRFAVVLSFANDSCQGTNWPTASNYRGGLGWSAAGLGAEWQPLTEVEGKTAVPLGTLVMPDDSLLYLSASRFGVTSVALAGGRVLLLGSDATAEIYDPVTKTITPTGNLNAARSNATATLVGGLVYVIGGNTYDNSLHRTVDVTTVEVFNPAGGGTFSLAGFIHVGRSNHTATLLPACLDVNPGCASAGKILVAGGRSYAGGGSEILRSVELYDPGAQEASLPFDMGATRASHTATVIPGTRKVLIAGGFSNGPWPAWNAEIYDPDGGGQGTFAQTANQMRAFRAMHSATALTTGPRAGQILLAGGMVDSPLTEFFDKTTSTFSDGPPLQTSRAGHAAVMLGDGRVAIIGGQGPDFTVPSDLSDVEISNPAVSQFVRAGDLRVTRYELQAHLLTTFSGVVQLFVAGGWSQSLLADNSAELFDAFGTPLVITTATLPDGTTGDTYYAQLTTSGGTGNGVSFDRVWGELPEGVAFSLITGAFGGDPAGIGGLSSFVIKATDSGLNVAYKSFTIRVNAIAITSSQLTNAVQGQAYSYQFTGAGAGTLTWSFDTGQTLPVDLTLGSNGVLGWLVPTQGGVGFRVKLRDITGQVVTKWFYLTVESPLVVGVRSLSDAVASWNYWECPSWSGGSGQPVWTITSGSAPPGSRWTQQAVVSPASRGRLASTRSPCKRVIRLSSRMKPRIRSVRAGSIRLSGVSIRV